MSTIKVLSYERGLHRGRGSLTVSWKLRNAVPCLPCGETAALDWNLGKGLLVTHSECSYHLVVGSGGHEPTVIDSVL